MKITTLLFNKRSGRLFICCFLSGIMTVGLCSSALGKAKKKSKGKDDYVGEPVLHYPLYVYCEGGEKSPPYAASGWMGNMNVIDRDDHWTENPREGDTCIRIHCEQSDEWFGIAWQSPANDWGHLPGGYDLSKAKKLTFWARGERGGEKVSFRVGLLRENQDFRDSMATQPRKIGLTKKWKKYTIPLRGKKHCIKTAFVWSVDECPDGFTFYLDDIMFK